MSNKIKRVLLIQPTYKLKYLDIPIGLLYIATYLKEQKVPVKIFTKDYKLLGRTINSFKPDLIGMYSTTLHYSQLDRYLNTIKNISKEIPIFLGGPHPSLDPDEVIKNDLIDGILIGEGEESFYNFIREYNKDEPDFSSVDGIYYKTPKRIFKNKKKKFSDLSKIPMPDYGLIDLKEQIKIWPYFDYQFNVRGTSIITSRGCPFNCTYCQPITNTMFGHKIRRHTVEQVLSKMDELHKRFGINSFFFHDDTFIIEREWIKDFCQKLIGGKRKYRWICNTRAETISEDVIRLMAKANCKEIRLGIESINQKVLEFYNKSIKIERIDKSIKLIKKYGIKVFGFFMIGAPMETEKMMWKTIRYAINSDLDFARFSILVNMPGTYLSKILKCEYKSLDGYDYIKSSTNNCSKINYKKLVFMRRIAHLLFYFHPKRLLMTLISVMSTRGLMAKLERF